MVKELPKKASPFPPYHTSQKVASISLDDSYNTQETNFQTDEKVQCVVKKWLLKQFSTITLKKS